MDSKVSNVVLTTDDRTSFRVLFGCGAVTVVSKVYWNGTSYITGGVKLFESSRYNDTARHWRTRVILPDTAPCFADVVLAGRSQIGTIISLIFGAT